MAWTELRRALQLVLETPEAGREALIGELAGGREGFERELRDLIDRDAGAGGFLDRSTAADPYTPFGVVPAPGARIGSYELVQPLGAGGMGSVWVARQHNPTRRVALKMLAVAPWSKSKRWRFEYEAGVLASLQHPRIAQIYESGVEPGGGGELLWFAMELVEGARDILRWADEQRAGRAQRLAKFAELCAAVEYGHRRGVIHRDLKPANILVDRDGHLKLIDFGVARALAGSEATPSLRTQTGEIVGTLQYMAPEQLGGRPEEIDVRCDVYALGVVLYRLLCGAPPFDFGRAGLVEVARAVLVAEPRRPSGLDPGLAGDMESILLKALEKTPQRRYGSVAELVDDLRRSQSHEPVRARPPTAAYRLRKFVRRNRAGVAIALVALLGLSIAVGGVTVGLFRARDGERSARLAGEEADRQARNAKHQEALALEQGQIATLEAARSREVLELFEGLFAGVDDTVDGREIKVADLLDAAVLRFDRSSALDPDTELVLRAVLGKMYTRLKLYARGRVELERAIAVFPATRQRPVDRARELESRANLGRCLALLGEAERGERLMREAQAEVERSALAAAVEGVAIPLLEHMHDQGAFDELRERAESLRAFAARTGRAELEALAAEYLALALAGLGCFEEAVPLHQELWRRNARLYGERHWRTLDSLVTWSFAEQRAEHLDQASRLLDLAIPLLFEVRGPQHEMTLSVLNNWALLPAARGDGSATVERLRELLEVYDSLESPPASGVMTVLNNLGNALVGLERFEQAEPILRRGAELGSQGLLAGSLKGCQMRFNHGVCLAALLRWSEAEPILLDSFECLEASLPPGHDVVVSAARTIAECYGRNGHPAEAGFWLRRD